MKTIEERATELFKEAQMIKKKTVIIEELRKKIMADDGSNLMEKAIKLGILVKISTACTARMREITAEMHELKEMQETVNVMMRFDSK